LEHESNKENSYKETTIMSYNIIPAQQEESEQAIAAANLDLFAEDLSDMTDLATPNFCSVGCFGSTGCVGTIGSTVGTLTSASTVSSGC
jgi:hypothetical protein